MLGTTGGSGLYAFDQYYTAYTNFDDSRLRWTQMMTDLYTKDGPNTDIKPNYYAEDFIVSIPPLDYSRWSAVTGNALELFSKIVGSTLTYGEKSFPRYNPYWKYFEDDVVSYDGKLYTCTDTDRRFSIVDIPPGELYPSLDGKYSQTETISGIYQALTSGGSILGNTLSSVTNAPNVGVSSLYAWEEWHYTPGLSGTTGTASIDNFLKNPPDEKDRNFQGYPEEITYVLTGLSGGVEESFQLYTKNYDPTISYYAGELVRWNNSLYRCRGAAEIIKGVGVGQPPNFSNSSTSWLLIANTETTDDITPGSKGVWKLIDDLDTTGNLFLETVFPEYVSSKVYNIGDYVTYLGKRYERLANGTIRLQNGATGTISGIAPVVNQLSDTAWIAYPYIDLTQEGKNIPAYDPVRAYSSGDLVLYKNIVYKNILNAGSTGLYVEGSIYSEGQIVIAYEGYKYVSLKNNNTDNPPYPRSGNSKYWYKAYDSITKPALVQTYNFQNDYNTIYHLSGGATLSVWYDGAVYTWIDPLKINYASLSPKFSNLYQYGMVKNIEPPLPEPFNHWVVCKESDHNGNLNKLTGTTIGVYSSSNYYQENDIVFYIPQWNSGSYYFRCTGKGFGTCINEKGDFDITELYVSSREINFGRALFDYTSKTRYNEVFITTESINDEDTSIPKWGEGIKNDPWASYGFCRNLRYKLAAGLELTTLTLKNDRDKLEAVKSYPSKFSGTLFTRYLNTTSLSITAGDAVPMLVTYTDNYIDTNYNTAEFFYYSHFLKHLYDEKLTVERLNAQNNQIYNFWLEIHKTYFNQSLQQYLMNDALKPSIQGIPLYMNELKLDPFPTDGTINGSLVQLKSEIERLKIGELFGNPRHEHSIEEGGLPRFVRTPLGLTFGKQYHPGGLTGISGTSYSSELGSIQPFTYFDSDTTANYGEYFFEKTIESNEGTVRSISTFIPGYTNARKVVDLNLDAIQAELGRINSYIGHEKLIRISGRKNPSDWLSSWYRNDCAVKTGMNDYPIFVPIITSKDKDYFKFNPENVWEGCSDVVRQEGAFKKNVWYTGSKNHLKQDTAFSYDGDWVQESFNPDKKGRDGYPGPEYTRYLFEPLFFDAKPNYYRFQEVEDTYNELFQSIEKTLPDKQFFDDDERDGHGIEYRIGWRNLKYVMQNGALIRITAEFYQEGTKTGSAIEVIQHNSPGVLFRINLDDQPTPITNFSSGRLTTTGNGPSIKTCVITMTGSVRNNFADTVSISETLRYIITPTGLVLSNAPNNRTPETPPSITSANNYSYWDDQIEGATGTTSTIKPFGSIDRNVSDESRTRDWVALEFDFITPGGGALTPFTKASAYWDNTRYTEKAATTISKSDLKEFQGKIPFKLEQNYMSIFQYVLHIKKCSQKEATSALPPRIAKAVKQSGYDQSFSNALQKFINDMRIVMIVVISLLLVATAVVTGGSSLIAGAAAAGGLMALVTSTAFLTSLAVGIAVSAAVAGVMYVITLAFKALDAEKYNPLTYIFGFLSDPGKLLFPSYDTDIGLITRCAMLEQIMQQTNPDISEGTILIGGGTDIRNFVNPLLNPVTYQEYFYAQLALGIVTSNYKNGSTLISDYSVDVGKLQFLATQYTSTDDQIKDVVSFLSDDTKDFIQYNQYYQQIIASYEQQLFFPIMTRQPTTDRDATLKITYLQWEPETVNSDGKAVLGSTGARPVGGGEMCYITISIEDPGEGFYDYDESGNRVPYRYHNSAPNKTTFVIPELAGATFSVEDLYLIGNYCYDDPDSLKTAVSGLTTFNHFDNETFGFNGKIAITWTGGNELVGKTFKIPSPIKSQTTESTTTSTTINQPPPDVVKSAPSGYTGKSYTVNAKNTNRVGENGRNIQLQKAADAKLPGKNPLSVGTEKVTAPSQGLGDIVPAEARLVRQDSLRSADVIPKPKIEIKTINIKTKLAEPPLPVKQPRWGSRKLFPNSKLAIPKPPPRPPGPVTTLVGSKAAAGVLGIAGAALDIYFAYENIKDAMNTPPESTNCTDISNRGNIAGN